MNYLKSDTWQRLRSQRLKIDHYKCQLCESPFSLDVHHVHYPLELGTEDAYKDLITLCRDCHESIEKQKKEYKEIMAERQRIRSEMIRSENEYEQKKQWNDHRNLINQFIEEHKAEDLSNVGIGKKNYCNLDIIKADFYPWMKAHGAKVTMYEDGPYVSGANDVQTYFRNRRYEIILYLKEKGYSQWDIHCRTLFTQNMIKKVFDKPEQAKAFLEKEREENNHD